MSAGQADGDRPVVPEAATGPVAKTPSVVAAFDFDGTITTTDSLRLFVRHTVGAYRYFLGGAAILPWLPAIKSGGAGRSFVKRRFLRATLGGMPVAKLQKAALAFQDVLATVIRPEMVARIRLHQQCGHQVVLVSASPSIYLKPWADAMGVRHVLATELALDGASFQGALSSPNCWGPEKVVRLKSWWKQQAPDTLYVYGDSRGDKEMAELATHSWIRGVDQAFPPLDR